MDKTWIDFLPTAFSAVGALISAIIAFFLYRTTREMHSFNKEMMKEMHDFNTKMSRETRDFNKRVAQINLFASHINTINDMNATILSKDEFLEIMSHLGGKQSIDIKQRRRKEWLLYIFLNDLEVTFIGWKEGMLDDRFAKPTIEQLVPTLMVDADAYDQVCNRGYDVRFVEHCTNVRNQILRKDKSVSKQCYEVDLKN